ncbi:hypothetical protein TNCV_2109741 [Trichonephila clavipes]|nr:hypothetical protein TNCV_2109741 [Trichonephila clavipes]
MLPSPISHSPVIFLGVSLLSQTGPVNCHTAGALLSIMTSRPTAAVILPLGQNTLLLLQRRFKKAYLLPLERDLRGKVSLNDSCLLVFCKCSTFVTNQTITDPCLFFTTK